MYTLRWEIERTFSIMEEMLQCECVWYTKNRNYDTTMGLKAIAYNLMIVVNGEIGENPRSIMKFVSC